MLKLTLRDFVRESNRIEGIDRVPNKIEIIAHQQFLLHNYLTVEHVERFVFDICDQRIRNKPGMDVSVGPHIPPPGGPEVEVKLRELLEDINDEKFLPFDAHVEYEILHPFLDGNGRSGRAIWAWMMKRDGKDPFLLPFLHYWYYQSLEGMRV